jgi:hypothetical protein
MEMVAADPEACIWNEDDITLYARPKVLFHPQNLTVQAVGFNYLKPEWRMLDDADKKWNVEYHCL